MIGSGLTTEKVMRSFENDAEIKEEEAEEEEEVTSRYRPLWDQDEDSDMDEWIGIVGRWIKPGELERKEEGESSHKPKTESPEPDDVQMNGRLDASEGEMEEEERPKAESGWIAAINNWDSSDEEDDGTNIWDEEIQFESDEEVAENAKMKVHRLTRSGHHYPDKGREEEKEKRKEPLEEIPKEDDLVLKQLKKTQAQASVWDLLCSFEKHRRTMVETLANMKISTDIGADQLMSALVGSQKGEILFTNKDLPIEGRDHNKPLFIKVEVRGKKTTAAMIDDGSAINVCPQSILPKLGLSRSDLK